MEPLHIINVYPETISDGFGVRYAIYLAGCTHHCRGCHNPGSWSPVAGEPLTELILSRIVAEINDNPILDGITISGGDPFYNPFALLALLRRLKEETHKNVWCYTGYTFERLLNNPKQAELLNYIDVLVDGKFKQSLHDESLLFRGSSNQRLIDVKKSLKEKKVVFYNYNPFII